MPEHAPAHNPCAQLARDLTSSWPHSGAIYAEFQNTNDGTDVWNFECAYDFASDAWFVIRVDGVNSSFGVSPTGQGFGGNARGGKFKYVSAGDLVPMSLLRPYFPGLVLRQVLARGDAFLRAEPIAENGRRLVFRLPNGDPWLPAPSPAKRSASGAPDPAQSALKEYAIEVSADLKVLAEQVDGAKRVEFTSSDTCPASGFQVSRRCPWPSEMVVLSTCRFDPLAVSQSFSLSEVEARAAGRRATLPNRRQPVEYSPPAGQEPPIPIRESGREHQGIALWAWVGAGGCLIVLAIAAFLRKRGG